MPCLRGLTLRVSCPDRFISDDRHSICINDLRSGAGLDATYAHQRSVLLKTSRQLPTVLALIELDGLARRIVLCPPDQWQHVPAIIQAAEIDLIVTDTDAEAAADAATAAVPQLLVQADQPFHNPVHNDRPIETEWILLTSGTTGQPKMAIHTLASLSGPLDDGTTVGTGARWSTFYDIRRYGGLQMLLRALLAGGSMILSVADESVGDFLLRLGRMHVTHISGTPSQWRRVLMSPHATAMAPTYVRLSGEIADQAILDHLQRTYAGANMAHAYASTEAGVAFDVRDGKAGFPAEWVGTGRKAELRIIDGTLHIRSSRTAKGYIGTRLNEADGFVDTGDLIELTNDRCYFAGRREGVINVSGQKVYPEEVEAVITQHPDVTMARVWGRRNSLSGMLVVADVMLQPDIQLADIHNDILTLCRQRLPAWKVPVSLHHVAAIALSGAGKIVRYA